MAQLRGVSFRNFDQPCRWKKGRSGRRSVEVEAKTFRLFQSCLRVRAARAASREQRKSPHQSAGELLEKDESSSDPYPIRRCRENVEEREG